MKKWFRKIGHMLTNESGVTLVMVLMVFVVLSVLGLGLLGVAVSNVKLTAVDRDYQATYYIAEAGLTLAYSDIDKLATVNYEGADSEVVFFNNLEKDILYSELPSEEKDLGFKPNFGEDPLIKIKVERANKEKPGEYKIISEGQIGKRSRTVIQTITIKWQPKGKLNIPANMAVYTNNTIDLRGSATITGSAGTNSSQANSVTLDGKPRITGNLYVPNVAVDIAVEDPDKFNITVLPKPPVILKLPPFPSIPEYKLHTDEQLEKNEDEKYNVILDGNLRIDNYLTDGYMLSLSNDISFKEIKLTSNYTLNVDTQGSNKTIVVDHLNVKNGHINVIGEGNLTIYVRDSILMGSSSSINKNGDIKKLTVYLKGNDDSTLKFSGDQRVNGTLYAETADIEITGSAGFKGNILTGGNQVKISGGTYSPSLIFAPNAAMEFTGGGEVEGVVVSNYFSASGGTKVSYDEIDISHPPFGEGTKTDTEDLINKKSLQEVK